MSQDHVSEDQVNQDRVDQGQVSQDHLSQDRVSQDDGFLLESSTGHPQVDEVLGTLDNLADLPLDQHVAAFEAAHVGLRDALKDARPAAAAHG